MEDSYGVVVSRPTRRRVYYYPDPIRSSCCLIHLSEIIVVRRLDSFFVVSVILRSSVSFIFLDILGFPVCCIYLRSHCITLVSKNSVLAE